MLEIFVQPLTAADSLTCFGFLVFIFFFRTEAAAYEIYENNFHTKYSGFKVLNTARPQLHWGLIETGDSKLLQSISHPVAGQSSGS